VNSSGVSRRQVAFDSRHIVAKIGGESDPSNIVYRYDYVLAGWDIAR